MREKKKEKALYARDACMCIRARVRMCARAARERENVCDKEGRRRVTS